MASSPSDFNAELVSFSILSNGKEIPDVVEIISIEILQYANAVDEALIILRDDSTIGDEFKVTDSKTFEFNAQIEIKLGYEHKNDSVFKGIVVQQKLIVGKDNKPQLHVSCLRHDHTGYVKRKLDFDINKKPVISVTNGIDIMDSELIISNSDKAQLLGNLTISGNTKAKVNDTIGIDGFGKRFSKKAIISGLMHQLHEGQWLTKVLLNDHTDLN
ncbi:hypothetical protein [Winogradskyella ouciana]|uniref:hypothetical protein n=1 Tax=Winogradskyella ouciana TaxID=2608631 RepID=UPI003D2A61FC